MQIIAHRGASGEQPEHTLAAYELALDQGADGFECDIRLTADNHLVCVHDRRIDRVSDGTGAVSSMTLAQLQRYDFGNGQQVLQLRTLLELVEANQHLDFFIETKHPTRRGGAVEKQLARELTHFGLAASDRIHVMSFSPLSLARVALRLPHLDRTYLWANGQTRKTRQLAAIARPTSLGPQVGELGRLKLLFPDNAHPVYTWTANWEKEVRRSLDLGVTWMATDFPGQARAWLEAQTDVVRRVS
ncbi:glycerophosphodiester phosphodiesterase [Corynebacterium ulceribovis]|uniref:glycerophosphodiester phosphodiesterase n=1 Tax=Corynebacterium ulceribovis TaxID=487732 RepID=UPI00035EDF04|nr:glycerophosphodiester phosphodiesterase family protein [Corynebacterium ulceribovis]